MEINFKNICSKCGKPKKRDIPHFLRCNCNMARSLRRRRKDQEAREKGEKPKDMIIIDGKEIEILSAPMAIRKQKADGWLEKHGDKQRPIPIEKIKKVEIKIGGRKKKRKRSRL